MTTGIQDDRAAGETAIQYLAALQQRIEHRMQERHRLVAAFDALADRIRTALADARSPLVQIAELDELNHHIHQLEGELTEDLEGATKKISTLAGPI